MLDNSLRVCNSPLASASPILLDVLVEMGQGTLLLTYVNNPTESVEPGDLVRVPVRRRLHAGLVMAERPEPPSEVPREQLQTVKNLILKGAFSRSWQQLIGWCARHTHTSLLQVLRTARETTVMETAVRTRQSVFARGRQTGGFQPLQQLYAFLSTGGRPRRGYGRTSMGPEESAAVMPLRRRYGVWRVSGPFCADSGPLPEPMERSSGSASQPEDWHGQKLPC